MKHQKTISNKLSIFDLTCNEILIQVIIEFHFQIGFSSFSKEVFSWEVICEKWLLMGGKQMSKIFLSNLNYNK